MNEVLPCDIVRDLMPVYADGLASNATVQAVEMHLEGCAACADELKRMREPEPPKGIPAEVDYLKKVRRRTTGKALLWSAALLLFGLTLLLYRFFYIGWEATAEQVACHVSVQSNVVTVSGTLPSSAQGVSRVTFSSSNGMVEAKVYLTPLAIFNSGDFVAEHTLSVPVTQVRLGEVILWEDGEEIGRTAARLCAAANPFAGDMPANARVAEILGIRDRFGVYTNELQTSEEPFGWTILLDTPLAPDEEAAAVEIMRADACAMLATVQNLGIVTWRYEVMDGEKAFTVTQEDATVLTKADIKSFGDSAARMQTLLRILNLQ